jgi:hypothetical protein
VPKFSKSSMSLRLVSVGFDASRRVDHRLLVDSYEAGVWPIKILDQNPIMIFATFFSLE